MPWTTDTREPRKLRPGPPALLGLMAELDRAAISTRLHDSRRTAGITQSVMAELLATSKRSVEVYESPKISTVPFDRLAEWAEICGVTKEWLLHGQNLPRATEISELQDQVQELREQVDRMFRVVLEMRSALPADQERP